MKDIDQKELNYENANNKIINFRISRVKIEDYFKIDSFDFKKVMKLAGVAKVESKEAMRSLFVTWLIGVKGMNSSDVIMLTKKDNKEKKAIGDEFVKYFADRPVYGATQDENEVKSHVGDFSKMIYKARKQVLFHEKLKYPANIKIMNATTYENMRKDVFGFVAELEYGMEGVTDNWMNSNNAVTSYNPHGVNLNLAFMENYGDDFQSVEMGNKSYMVDENKMKIVKSMGKITKLLSDDKVSEVQKNHLIRVGKFLPGKKNKLENEGALDKGAVNINLKGSIEDTASDYGMLVGDILETMVNSVVSGDGKDFINDSNKAISEAIDKFNNSAKSEVENALNIIAHNNNKFVEEIAINKDDRYQFGLILDGITKEELAEAAEAFDKLYSPVSFANAKFLNAEQLRLENCIIVEGISIYDRAVADTVDKGYSQTEVIQYAKALALRAFVHPEIHMFYQMAVGNINPFEKLYDKSENIDNIEDVFKANDKITRPNVRMISKKESIAIKPDDFRMGLVYDVENDDEVVQDVKTKYTKPQDAQLPPPIYIGDAEQSFNPPKVDIPKNMNQPLNYLENKVLPVLNINKVANDQVNEIEDIEDDFNLIKDDIDIPDNDFNLIKDDNKKVDNDFNLIKDDNDIANNPEFFNDVVNNANKKDDENINVNVNVGDDIKENNIANNINVDNNVMNNNIINNNIIVNNDVDENNNDINDENNNVNNNDINDNVQNENINDIVQNENINDDVQNENIEEENNEEEKEIDNNEINNHKNIEQVAADAPQVVDPEELNKAKRFAIGMKEYEAAHGNIYEWLMSLKDSLASRQKNKDSNFSEDIAPEGSEDYRKFAKSIQNAINVFFDKTNDSLKVSESIRKVIVSANKLQDHWFLYSDGVGGAGFEAADKVLKEGTKLYNMFYTARVAVCNYSKVIDEKGGKTAYGNLSYNEIHDKGREIINQYKNVPGFNDAATYQADAAVMIERSKKQLEITKKLKDVSRTMCKNYEYTMKKTPDEYLKMSSKRSVTAIARWIVTKNYLDKVYKPGVTVGELEELSKFKVKDLKNEVKKLYKDPLFTQVVSLNPENAFSVWEAVERDDYLKVCNDKTKAILGAGNEDDLVNSFTEGLKKDEANQSKFNAHLNKFAEYIFYKSISTPGNMQIRKILMASDEISRDGIIIDVKSELVTSLKKAMIRDNYTDKIKAKEFLNNKKLVIDTMRNMKTSNGITKAGIKTTEKIKKQAEVLSK